MAIKHLLMLTSRSTGKARNTMKDGGGFGDISLETPHGPLGLREKRMENMLPSRLTSTKGVSMARQLSDILEVAVS